MKLDDFLKVKKVKLVGPSDLHLTKGKHYTVLGVTDRSCIVNDDNECEAWADMNYFEPVLAAENPEQGVELTPEFEAVEPQFKAGDKVYAPSVGSKIYTVKDVGDGWCYPIRIDCSYDEDHEFTKEGLITAEGLPVLFLATELNHALLSQLYPNIEFEKPPTQADIDNEAVDKLAQAMKNKLAKKREQGYHGWATCKHGDLVQLLINHVDKGDPIDVANFCAFLFARGEPLTESVLDE